MKTLTLMVGALALALWFLYPNHTPPTPAAKPLEAPLPIQTPQPTAPATTPVPSRPFVASIPPRASKRDLVHLQGQILRATEDGVLMICTPNHPPQNLFAIAREQESDMSVIVRHNRDAYRYGPLYFLEGGKWHPTKDYPNNQAEGMVLVVNFPRPQELHTGEFFQLIAVKTGDFYPPEKCEVYTVKFDYNGFLH